MKTAESKSQSENGRDVKRVNLEEAIQLSRQLLGARDYAEWNIPKPDASARWLASIRSRTKAATAACH